MRISVAGPASSPGVISLHILNEEISIEVYRGESSGSIAKRLADEINNRFGRRACANDGNGQNAWIDLGGEG